jgi:hypothetical protein
MPVWLPIVSEYKDNGTRAAQRDLGKLQGSTKRVGAAIGKSFKVAAIGLAAVGGAAAVAGAALVGAGERASTSNARIRQIADSMGLFGDQAGAVTDRLTKLAEATALQTGVDQNAIKATQAKLLTFASLAESADEIGGSFDRATQAAIDLAAAGFGSAEGNAAQLGKALNDPVKGLAALTKSGVTFTAAEKDMIEAMVEAGDMAGAQATVLAAIETQVGGTAAATANASDRMKVAFSQLSEKAGQKLLPVFEKLTAFLIDKVFPTVEKIMAVFDQRGLAGVWDYLTAAAAKAFPKVVAFLGSMLSKLKGLLLAAGQAFVDWIGPRIAPMLAKLAELIGQAANWLLDTGLPMMVDKLVQLGQAFVDWVGPQIPPLLKELGKLAAKLLQWIATVLVPKVGAQALKLVGALLGWIGELVPQMVKGLAVFIAQLVPQLPGIFAALYTNLGRIGMELGGKLVGALVEALKSLGSKGLEIGKSLANGIITFINTQVIARLNDMLEFKVGRFTIDAPDLPPIPQLAAGGIVTRATTALIGEAGPEAVIPLRRLEGAQGGTVNVTVNGALDPVAVARQIRQLLNDDARRRTGSIALA